MDSQLLVCGPDPVVLWGLSPWWEGRDLCCWVALIAVLLGHGEDAFFVVVYFFTFSLTVV